MRFGLDFGTSNTAMAVCDGGRVRLLPLDAVAGAIMPSVLYVRRDGTSVVGRAAIDAYLKDNAERGPVRREMKMLGVRVASSDPTQPSVEAHILTDVNAPGRLFQALKTFLGDPLVMPTNVFGTAKGLSELIAVIFAHVRERAGKITGVLPSEITLGRPVRFVGGSEVEARALERLREAATLAGFADVRFALEPVAAAHAADVAPGISLVFDFGGGTLDICVVRRDAAGVEVIATTGRDIGGDRMTELLIDDAVAPALGARATWGEKRLGLPAFIVNAINDWHALSALNEKWLLDALDDLIRAGAPRRELAALRTAIERQLGYAIFATADDAKRRLSDETATIVSFHQADVDVDARVTRARFERRIAGLVSGISELLVETLAVASLGADDIAEVVCTGGSSATPVVRALLAARFPRAKLRDADPYSSVAAGLVSDAVAA